MKRVSSQLVFCSPSKILRNCVLEQDENGALTQIIDLQIQQSETHNTLFFDGIITNGIVSLKTELSDIELRKLKSSYNYFDFSKPDNFKLEPLKPLLIDFGTSDTVIINKILKKYFELFLEIDIFQFLNGCCFLPMQILKRNEFIEQNHKPQLLLWKGLNLIDKQITAIAIVEII